VTVTRESSTLQVFILKKVLVNYLVRERDSNGQNAVDH
jgi:hypothetical protein